MITLPIALEPEIKTAELVPSITVPEPEVVPPTVLFAPFNTTPYVIAE